jgi:two-component system alkaline phosphatase synthesis response regulator PhoP
MGAPRRSRFVAQRAVSLILIADDNPHAHRMGRQILQQEGHEVQTASNGDEALAYLSENRPALVMLDTRMPGPSGYEVCEFIKGSSELAGVKVVLLAGPLEPFDPAHAARVGSDAVLHKPLDAYSLIETVHSLIGKPGPANNQIERDECVHQDEPVHQQDKPPVMDEAVALAAEGPTPIAEALDEAPAETAVAAEQQPAPPVSASDDPFDAAFDELVQLALESPDNAPKLDPAAVRAAVLEVLESHLPALADAVTQRVLERHETEDTAAR